MGSVDVGNDQCSFGRARRGRCYSPAERDRAPRARGCELNDANALCRSDIRVEPPTQAFVELLGSLNVGYRNDMNLELHFDSRSAGARFLLFHTGARLTHLILLWLTADTGLG